MRLTQLGSYIARKNNRPALERARLAQSTTRRSPSIEGGGPRCGGCFARDNKDAN